MPRVRRKQIDPCDSLEAIHCCLQQLSPLPRPLRDKVLANLTDLAVDQAEQVAQSTHVCFAFLDQLVAGHRRLALAHLEGWNRLGQQTQKELPLAGVTVGASETQSVSTVAA